MFVEDLVCVKEDIIVGNLVCCFNIELFGVCLLVMGIVCVMLLCDVDGKVLSFVVVCEVIIIFNV